MTFRRTLLTLAFPALSLVVAGCNPPIDEAGKGGAVAPAGNEPAKAPVTESAPADVKPKTEAAAPVDAGTAPAPAEKPPEAPKGEQPKLETPK